MAFVLLSSYIEEHSKPNPKLHKKKKRTEFQTPFNSKSPTKRPRFKRPYNLRSHQSRKDQTGEKIDGKKKKIEKYRNFSNLTRTLFLPQNRN